VLFFQKPGLISCLGISKSWYPPLPLNWNAQIPVMIPDPQEKDAEGMYKKHPDSYLFNIQAHTLLVTRFMPF
jgi:hypothetical protein